MISQYNTTINFEHEVKKSMKKFYQKGKEFENFKQTVEKYFNKDEIKELNKKK